MKNIVLIGMPGSGKTTLSQTLSKTLQRPHVDLDTYIVETYHMSIPDMFAYGEEYFRERETLCCQKVANTKGHIIATGGGIIKNANNIKYLKETGCIIYLDRPIQEIIKDLDVSTRPLLNNDVETLYDLYHERHQKYLAACDIHIINTKDITTITKKIIEQVKYYQEGIS